MSEPTEWNRPSVPPDTADILERLPKWELNHSTANKTIRSLCGEVEHLRAKNERLQKQALALALQLQRRLAEAVPSGNRRGRGRAGKNGGNSMSDEIFDTIMARLKEENDNLHAELENLRADNELWEQADNDNAELRESVIELVAERDDLQKRIANTNPWADCYEEGYCIFCDSYDLHAEGPIPRTIYHVHDPDCFWIKCCDASNTPYGDSNIIRKDIDNG